MEHTFRQVSTLLFATLSLQSALLADTVKLYGKPAFEDVQIIGFKQGKLSFRGLSGQVLQKPIAQVEWFARDRDAELTLAERLASGGDWEKAIPHYEKARTEATEGWLREWTELRLLRALDQAGHLGRSTELFIELTLAAPGRPGLRPPLNAGEPNTPASQSARSRLIAALNGAPPPAARAALRNFLLELVLYDDVEPLPAELGIPTAVLPQRSREVGGARASRERPRYGLLPERAVYTDMPTLRDDSIVIAAARQALDQVAAGRSNVDAEARRAQRLLEGAEPFVRESGADQVRVLKARLAVYTADRENGIYELSRLGQAVSGETGCEALFYLIEAQTLAGKVQDARRAYDGLVARCPDWRKRAQAAMTRPVAGHDSRRAR